MISCLDDLFSVPADPAGRPAIIRKTEPFRWLDLL
jgi:hypothetical protein